MSGDTGGNGRIVGVNRNGIRGSVRIGVIDNHLREVKAVAEVRKDRCADEATVEVFQSEMNRHTIWHWKSYLL